MRFWQQATKYDCAPVGIVNCLQFLYPRTELAPEPVRSAFRFCLDQERHGTSNHAVQAFVEWLKSFGRRHFQVTAEYTWGSDVTGVKIAKHLARNHRRHVAAALIRVDYRKVSHYVTDLGTNNGSIYLFDPYLDQDGNHLHGANVELPLAHLSHKRHRSKYWLGQPYDRELVVFAKKL